MFLLIITSLPSPTFLIDECVQRVIYEWLLLLKDNDDDECVPHGEYNLILWQIWKATFTNPI